MKWEIRVSPSKRIQPLRMRKARKNVVPVRTARKSQIKFYGASEKGEATKLPNKPNSRETSEAGPDTHSLSSHRGREKGKTTKQAKGEHAETLITPSSREAGGRGLRQLVVSLALAGFRAHLSSPSPPALSHPASGRISKVPRSPTTMSQVWRKSSDTQLRSGHFTFSQKHWRKKGDGDGC